MVKNSLVLLVPLVIYLITIISNFNYITYRTFPRYLQELKNGDQPSFWKQAQSVAISLVIPFIVIFSLGIGLAPIWGGDKKQGYSIFIDKVLGFGFDSTGLPAVASWILGFFYILITGSYLFGIWRIFRKIKNDFTDSFKSSEDLKHARKLRFKYLLLILVVPGIFNVITIAIMSYLIGDQLNIGSVIGAFVNSFTYVITSSVQAGFFIQQAAEAGIALSQNLPSNISKIIA